MSHRGTFFRASDFNALQGGVREILTHGRVRMVVSASLRARERGGKGDGTRVMRDPRTASVDMTRRTGPIPALEGNPVGTTLEFAPIHVNVAPAFIAGASHRKTLAEVQR